MVTNSIIDFIIGKHNALSRTLYYLKLKKEKISHITFSTYYYFIECLERMFFYDNSIKSSICSYKDERGFKYIILGNEKYQIYISPREDGVLSIIIYRLNGYKIQSNISFCYEEFDKVTPYDKYIINNILKIMKSEILKLFKKYIKQT